MDAFEVIVINLMIRGWARQGMAWQGTARLGTARQGKARNFKWKEMMNVELKNVERSVTLSGLTPILFDRYSGNNKEQLAVMDKVYLDKERMVLPSTNILSFLSAQNTESAPQRVIGRGYKEVCKAAQSFVTISPFSIPFTRNGKELTLANAELKVHFAVAKIMKGKLAVPNPKERPMLDTPWELSFKLNLLETPELNEVLLKKLFEKGGIAIGLGTFRGVFGKFKVSCWENEADKNAKI